MKIIESSIIGKKSQEACEDGMVITDDFIAVIDGSTSKTPKHLNPDMKNGRYAMMLISEYIREELKADASVDDFCQGVTAYIYNKVYEKLGVAERLKEHPEERLTASAILYSRIRNEVWMVGDCQAIIAGKLYENGKPYEQEIARKRVELIEQGLSPAEARKQIEPLLIEAMLSGQNQTYTVRCRQHGVLRRYPTGLGALAPARHALLDGGSAQHARIAKLGQARTVGVLHDAAGKLDGAQLIGGAAVGAIDLHILHRKILSAKGEREPLVGDLISISVRRYRYAQCS